MEQRPATETRSLDQVQMQLAEFFRGLSLRQRLLLAGGTVLVGGTLWLFVTLIGKPKMISLYSGLRAGEAQTLASRLAVKNIPYELSPDGTGLLVASDRVDEARLETAAQGLPRNARMGFELFDTPNWAGSDFTEKVNYQRALEGELERTLQTISEVEAVRVHLVLPRESLFTEQEHDAKAAVILKTRASLSAHVLQAIPQLVASAVDRLRPENVTVVDADSQEPLAHARVGPGGRAPFGLDVELAQTLVRTLEPVVGSEHVRASVHVEYDLASTDDTQEIYDPKATAATSLQRSEENMGGTNPAGVPGTASNVPGTASTAVPFPGSDQSSSRSESSTFAVSKSVHHSIQPPGRVRRVAAAVLVDDAVEFAQQNGKTVTTRRKRTSEEMKEIEQLASAAIGIDTQRGDLLAVENLAFQQAPAEMLAPLSKWDRLRRMLQTWAGAVRYVGVGALFLVMYFLMLRPVKRQILNSFRQLQTSAPGKGLPAGASGTVLDGSALPDSSEEGKRAAQLKRQLTEKVKAEPVAASRLVQSWIREGKA
jgi:flagellar M-ring protein FliF